MRVIYARLLAIFGNIIHLVYLLFFMYIWWTASKLMKKGNEENLSPDETHTECNNSLQ